ncbi:hypothetical protein [Bosea sp. ANAM02]|uniref:hypothetical protein n=1 Tax=Bosea sp. ANAM02 TaxID=2020412 RepID=UPI00140EB2F7|nr:hypothetical protein [Bosea sp. ANAM02]BCB20686.1 hypothetical protein OCUBac02_35800 [Bosea sp. ANAM02]
MKLFVFACKNITNIWAGVGARRWAVSHVDSANMAGRATRAKLIKPGHCGVIYCSHPNYKSLTTPFIFKSTPDIQGVENEVWPEEWRMPFSIAPLGSPRLHWKAREAVSSLPFNKSSGNHNIATVLKPIGTAVFSPIEVGDEDWAMILERLAEI